VLLIEAACPGSSGPFGPTLSFRASPTPTPLIVELAVPLMCVGASRIKANAVMPLRR